MWNRRENVQPQRLFWSFQDNQTSLARCDINWVRSMRNHFKRLLSAEQSQSDNQRRWLNGNSKQQRFLAIFLPILKETTQNSFVRCSSDCITHRTTSLFTRNFAVIFFSTTAITRNFLGGSVLAYFHSTNFRLVLGLRNGYYVRSTVSIDGTNALFMLSSRAKMTYVHRPSHAKRMWKKLSAFS